LKDAELLLRNGRWERATALAILAIEEAGKVAILRSILLARNEAELRTEWRAYRSHTKKNVNWIFLKLVERGARKLEDFRPILDTGSDHGKIIDALKQECFYSHVAHESEWFSPDQRIDSEMAKSMFTVARLLVKEGPSPMTTASGIGIVGKTFRPCLEWADCRDEEGSRSLLR
jgi:AbiV family abortive infection protein